MSYTCKLNGTQTDYPCSANCALFGDCVDAYKEERQITRAAAQTNSTRETVKRNDKAALICSKCKTEATLRLVLRPDGTLRWEIEPYCAHCGARLIE